MQIVINIPKGRYEDILSGKEFTLYQCDVREVLKNGTPLPKGHGDLIDRDELCFLTAIHDAKFERISWSDAIRKIKYSASAIIEADEGE